MPLRQESVELKVLIKTTPFNGARMLLFSNQVQGEQNQ